MAIDYKQQRKEIAEIIKGAGIEFGYRCTDQGDHKSPSKWVVSISTKRGQFSTEYTQGAAYRTKATAGRNSQPTAPDIVDVLYCLISDSEAGREVFADFCENFGYDQDSRKAFETWQACQNAYVELRKLGVLSAADWSTIYADF